MAKTVQVGDAQFEILTSAQSGQWTAEARRVDSGDRFGPSFIAPGGRQEGAGGGRHEAGGGRREFGR